MDEQKRQQQALNPKRPAPLLLEPLIRLSVEGTETNPDDQIFIRALKESGCINKEIEVKEVRGKDENGRSVVFGWCAFSYQASPTEALHLWQTLHPQSPFKGGRKEVANFHKDNTACSCIQAAQPGMVACLQLCCGLP